MRRRVNPGRVLEAARGYLEPAPADAARVRQQIAEQLSAESGVRSSEPLGATRTGALGSAARGTRVWSPGLSRLVLVGLATGALGFWLGRFVERSSGGERAARTTSPNVALVERDPVPASGPSALAAREMAPSEPPGAAGPEVGAAARTPSASARPVHPRGASSRRVTPLRGAVASAAARERPEPELAPPAASQSIGSAGAAAAGLDLRAALELVRRAEAERRSGRPESALALLRELEAGAPALLVEERLVTAALSECDLGNAERARPLARAVANSNPSSIYTRRLRASCAAGELPGGEK